MGALDSDPLLANSYSNGVFPGKRRSRQEAFSVAAKSLRGESRVRKADPEVPDGWPAIRQLALEARPIQILE
jgi:hypothetical protein